MLRLAFVALLSVEGGGTIGGQAQCDAQCKNPSCASGSASNGGFSLIGGVCEARCSRMFGNLRYCGSGAAYEGEGSVDCTGCVAMFTKLVDNKYCRGAKDLSSVDHLVDSVEECAMRVHADPQCSGTFFSGYFTPMGIDCGCVKTNFACDYEPAGQELMMGHFGVNAVYEMRAVDTTAFPSAVELSAAMPWVSSNAVAAIAVVLAVQ